jgi:hypothetical protein
MVLDSHIHLMQPGGNLQRFLGQAPGVASAPGPQGGQNL